MMEPVGENVRRALRGLGPQGAIPELVAAWPAAVGVEIARNAWPARVQRDGTLVVHARDAVWAYELSQRVAEIARRLPGAPRLRFVPGPIPELDASDAAAAATPQQAATPEQAREAARWAAAIEDEELRELVAGAARASLARAAADRSV